MNITRTVAVEPLDVSHQCSPFDGLVSDMLAGMRSMSPSKSSDWLCSLGFEGLEWVLISLVSTGFRVFILVDAFLTLRLEDVDIL